MKARVIEQAVKNLVLKAEISLNRKLGREFIPATVDTFCIETSSACNLKCRFCAYEKKQSPRVSMSNEMFADCVEQALDLGYREFHLTPCTGDVFMDKHVFDKLEAMDRNVRVRAYHFFTNFTVLDTKQIERLLRLKKLSRITISIYGHDEASFIALANSSTKIYQRLLTNLEALLTHSEHWPFGVSIGFRSTFDVPKTDTSDLLKMIARYRKQGVGIHSSHGIYNNWGGSISQADVSNLNLHILSSDGIYKLGPCVKLFDSFQVTASGIVNGCSCRDVDTTLKIGDVRTTPLRQILSKNNPAYQNIITRQLCGDFQDVCKHCDYYRSIYHQPSSFRKKKIATQTMEKFLAKTTQR